ncbi:hypothetical protein BDV25DRAFT_78401 [Aspergillus avenaceus]|uniref:Uncharacterized protein n=1 Tax=Aspergillus avenaceus TaxID=36643 RepID=A0A5N6TFA5_ASPAV|nr:hypothetical protein BDV25DRAFT_78401 [Aspergillus avenaceus]
MCLEAAPLSPAVKYPQSIADLSKSDLRLLTAMLIEENLNEPGSPNGGDEHIISAIKKLPPSLRKRRLIFTNRRPTATLCHSHGKLNAYVIRHVFELLRYEVTTRMECMYWYHERVHADLRCVVEGLEEMHLIWTPSRRSIFRGPVRYQQNQCHACILARVVKEPRFLILLRTAILSRILVKRNYHVPRLLPFVDEAVRCHESAREQIHYLSGMWAESMKHQRNKALCKLQSSKPIATVPLVIDPESLVSSRRECQRQVHENPDLALQAAVKKGESDADTLSGIIEVYKFGIPSPTPASSPTHHSQSYFLPPTRTQGSSIYSSSNSGTTLTRTFNALTIRPLTVSKASKQPIGKGVTDQMPGRDEPPAQGSEELAAEYQKLLDPHLHYTSDEHEGPIPGSAYTNEPTMEHGSPETTWAMMIFEEYEGPIPKRLAHADVPAREHESCETNWDMFKES